MAEQLLSFLMAGLIFGFSGGIAPGPTMAIVIAQAVQYDWKEGAKVAIAPLLTDGPIIVVGISFLSLVREFEAVVGMVSLLGACFLSYLAYESWNTKGMHVEVRTAKPRSLLKGVVANLLNPSPYLFWFTVGCPVILKAADTSLLAVSAFIATFFVGLVGTKVVVAILVGPFRSFLRSQGYVYIMRFLSFALFVYALLFFLDGLHALGLLTSDP
ncbi:MAG: LysE family transporter [Candidatus Andersenbacteria bacterium]